MKINEIFYSLQGEGYWTGTPAVFVRFSGCNLSCPFCDTDHQSGTACDEDDIVAEVVKYPSHHVVITGGEPTLQLTLSLVDKLHAAGRQVHIETNGSVALDDSLAAAIDWITASPKSAPVKIQRIDELKVLYHGAGQEMAVLDDIAVTHPECRYLQPCDTGDACANARILDDTIGYIKEHPQWRLSLQTHKLLGIR